MENSTSVKSHLHSPLWDAYSLRGWGGGREVLGLWQVLLLEVLRSSFLHPGCAEAVGEGGREPLQGLGKSGERLTPAAFCCHLAAAHVPALYPEEGMRDAHESSQEQASLQILPLLPLVWAFSFNSHLFLAAISGIVLLTKPKATLELGRSKQGAQDHLRLL